MSSLPQEWEDNKKALLEFAWATHMGIKGMVCMSSYFFYKIDGAGFKPAIMSD